MKKYIVNHIPGNKLTITGMSDDQLWELANSLTDFSSPWRTLQDTETEFRALWDGDNLYFMFKVVDSHIHVDKKYSGNESINVSDRVELFFRQNDSLNPYYCLEIDPTPRIMDFRAFPNRAFDFDWNWPENHLTVKSHSGPDGFIVEGKISMASLKKLNLIHDQAIETGIFRAKYVKVDASTYEPIWITWVNPETETPDFHIDSSFGVLILGQEKSDATDR